MKKPIPLPASATEVLDSAQPRAASRKSLINEIRAILDDNSESLIRTLLDVALGKSIPVLDETGKPTSGAPRVPGFRDMLAATEFLFSYGVGKPVQAVELVAQVSTERQTQIDLSKLSDEELFSLAKIQAKLTNKKEG